jgi:hypothetical protein
LLSLPTITNFKNSLFAQTLTMANDIACMPTAPSTDLIIVLFGRSMFNAIGCWSSMTIMVSAVGSHRRRRGDRSTLPFLRSYHQQPAILPIFNISMANNAARGIDARHVIERSRNRSEFD